MTAAEALAHGYLAGLHDAEQEPTTTRLQHDIEDDELDFDALKAMVTREARPFCARTCATAPSRDVTHATRR